MYAHTLRISPRGQIVLPRKVRDVLQSSIISIEMNEQYKVSISPVRNLGGALAAYQKESSPTAENISEHIEQKNTIQP